MSRGAYKQYSDSLKLAIAESGNVNLFPELNIPKSTAYHWVKRGVRKAEAPLDTDKIVCGDVLLAVHRLLESVTSAIDTDMIAESQAEAIKLILSNKQLQLENWLPKNLQKKLSKRTHHCRKSGSGSCLRRYPWQLSPSEVSKMKRMVESSRYAHLPICSLALLAKRKGILSCSVHTWYKYVAKNQWRRPNLQKRKKPRRYCGLKAKHPHEYWHQDVTKIPMENGEFRSLQVILDNRSRAVLGWR